MIDRILTAFNRNFEAEKRDVIWDWCVGVIKNTALTTEMGIDEARKYFDSDCADLLLSINHEVNNYRIIELSGMKRKLIYRFPFWLREGYVEELYEQL